MANDIDAKSQPDRVQGATSGRSSLRTEKEATGLVTFVVVEDLSEGAVLVVILPTEGLKPGQAWIKGQADLRNFESPSLLKAAVVGPLYNQMAVPNIAGL